MTEAARRTCFFCTSTRLTKEHINPKWLQDIPLLHVPHGAGRITSSQTKPKERVGETVLRPGNMLETQAKCACKPCNTGWMSRVENTAKDVLRPLIERTRASGGFTENERRTLAVWMTLRAMVADSQRPLNQQLFRRRDREDFAAVADDSRIPPHNTSVWIATPITPGVTVTMKGVTHRAVAYTQSHALTTREDYRLGECTSFLGSLAFQVIYWSGPSDPLKYEVVTHPAWTSRTLRIWPIEKEVAPAWPPAIPLDDDMASRFLKRCIPPFPKRVPARSR